MREEPALGERKRSVHMSASGPAGSPSGTGSDGVRERIVAMALEIPELSPRELATRFIDAESWRGTAG